LWLHQLPDLAQHDCRAPVFSPLIFAQIPNLALCLDDLYGKVDG